MTPPASVLVICTRRIGDVLLSTPLVRSVKRAWPQARVEALVFAGTEGVLAGNPDLSAVLTVPRHQPLPARVATMLGLRRRHDLALPVLTSDRAVLNAWAAGRRRVGFIEPGGARWKRALLDAAVDFDDVDTHTVAMNLRLCEPLGIPKVHEVVAGTVDGGDAAIAALLPFDSAREPFAVVHVSPKFAYKRWTASGWVALLHWLRAAGLRVVLTGGGDPEERAEVAVVLALAPGIATDLSARLSLSGVAALLRRARVYVGPDTAVTHLAAATGVPTVALFGPSNPVKWGPWPAGCTAGSSPWRMRGTQHVGNVTLVQGEGDCVPCREEGCDRHVGSASRCLQELPADRVIAAVEAALATTR